uniref:ElaA protein n=1 Tax=Candidatus Kentrum sp. MB TaxID=2138164 RepID=A0A450Y1U5_9GAMM|nr:MAG: ElaA protein [Candidatus Kentron sp. MB]VFK35513.1 MAG: ElaA protein [Candidatus Kentron sp. MB]VFK77330.1 MAG: ElaA protein [Candidatus Kentron sp. MB]
MLRFRQNIFIIEQENITEDIDETDKTARHILLRNDNGCLIGYCRLATTDNPDEEVKLRRVAIEQSSRGKGLGLRLIHRAEREAKETGAYRIVIESQFFVRKFYEKCGYKITSEPYFNGPLKHVRMEKTL